MYDEHGSEGHSSGNTKDFDPVANDDNSINTNAFNPTDGSGFCLATTTTVTQASVQTIALGGGSVTDTATVTGQSGQGLPTGHVDFYVCGPTEEAALCGSTSNPQGTPIVPGQNDTGFVSHATSDAFTPTSAGTWCFAAVFVPGAIVSGSESASVVAQGSSYSGSSDNQTGTIDPNECFNVTASPSQTTTSTSAANTGGSVVIGPDGSVTDTATVTGEDGTPTGEVAFFLCGPLTQDATCSVVTGTPEGTPTLSGSNGTATAVSNSVTPTKVGVYCFSAVYAGDSTYAGSHDNTSGDVRTAECFAVTPAGTVATTQTSAATTGEGSVVIGASGTVTDTVTVTGNATAGAPDGTVAFFVCGPLTSAGLCTSSGTAEGTPTLTGATSSTSTATSNAFTPTAPGTYCFGAAYTPADGSNYTGSADNMTGDVQVNECFTVSNPATNPSTPTTTTVPPTTTTTQAKAAAQTIAFTGADIGGMAGGGAALIALGGILVLIARRRRTAGDAI
jgi:hypothetical protein